MASLSVNVNKIATLRNTRALGIPSVVRAATIALDAGAAGITVHPRPDQRHIRTEDVHELATLLKRYPHAEFNIEGNPFHGYMELVEAVRPTQCTLVPDEPSAFTSNQGWRLDAGTIQQVGRLVRTLRNWGCRVSLFMDHDGPIAAAAGLGAHRVELYTEPYAAAFAAGDIDAVTPFKKAAAAAVKAGMGVNAGHDLNLENLPALVAAIPGLAEVSIGHALVADALEFGLDSTVRRYRAAASPAGTKDSSVLPS